jgi:hypothetical protein
VFRTLFGYIPSLEDIVPFGSKRVEVCLRRKRAEVTNFSAWGSFTQLKLSLPSTVVSGTRFSTRGKKASRNWAIYGGKSASWKAGVSSSSTTHVNGATYAANPEDHTGQKILPFYRVIADQDLENITMMFWTAEDDAAMEEFSLVENLMITRFGLFTDDGGQKADFRAMESFGIFSVNHDFSPCNDKAALNDVQGSLVSKEVMLSRDRARSRRHLEAEDAQTLEDLRTERLAAQETDTCPPCRREIGPNNRVFHRERQQWLCHVCHKRAKLNNDVVVPLQSSKPFKNSAENEQEDCGVNWCPKDMGVLTRKWVLPECQSL